MSERMRSSDWVGVCILVLFVLAVFFLWGMNVSHAIWEGRAVEQGHAEYYLDSNNERQWRWLPVETNE